jgi:DNA-directed RNA polymerase subunit F
MKAINFKLTDAPIFEDNPEFLAIPEFERLTEKQMRYVMLVDFYGSPLRLMNSDDRKQRAAIMSGYKLEANGKRLDINGRNIVEGKVGTVEVARRILREIQHDNERELMDALNAQLDEMIRFFKKPNKTTQELEKSVQMMTKLPAILETKKKILEILNFREQDVIDTETVETGEVKTSLLEDFNNQD